MSHTFNWWIESRREMVWCHWNLEWRLLWNTWSFWSQVKVQLHWHHHYICVQIDCWLLQIINWLTAHVSPCRKLRSEDISYILSNLHWICLRTASITSIIFIQNCISPSVSSCPWNISPHALSATKVCINRKIACNWKGFWYVMSCYWL